MVQRVEIYLEDEDYRRLNYISGGKIGLLLLRMLRNILCVSVAVKKMQKIRRQDDV